MAASTSASTECSVPSTIWSTMGSTCVASALATAQHQVAQPVDLEAERALDHGGGAVLLDDRGPHASKAGAKVGPPVDREAVPLAHRPGGTGGRGPLQPRPLDGADAGDLPVDEFDHLSGPVGVAVGPLMGVVEARGRRDGVEGAGHR